MALVYLLKHLYYAPSKAQIMISNDFSHTDDVICTKIPCRKKCESAQHA